ncbi:hypothetical protein KV205_04315 [Streptomyces sp. SKN60]|uniref:hypothetical protein n=1 Tax=Streptomyces sp. SKN60 TaxID=2855506 RepID=UPI002246D8A1|nr:hypothetical protein [Streptomyces sp. SKN60]MCX2179758.1 hypothetical protein [Streptomyces sp. SKN60]
MGNFTYSDLMALDLGKLATAVSDWESMVADLAKLATATRDGLVKKSDGADWKGVNADVTREFVHKTAKEVADLQAEAASIAAVLADAHAELTNYQKQAKSLTGKARRGDPSHNPPDPSLIITDGPGATVRVMEAMCTPEGTNQRTKDYIQWYADTLTGIVQHAAEVDAAAVRALRKSHGNDPHNAGHAKYTSLDEEQLPRAEELAGLAGDADAKQRAELKRLWESLSPEARASLWLSKKDDLMAAGVLSPTAPQIAADGGAGRHGSESPGFEDWTTKRKMELLATGADWKGMTDASRNMAHYLGNSGTPMGLPVDKMMADVPEFKEYVDGTVRLNQDAWRQQALEEFRKNGGKPVAFPVEAKRENGFYFAEDYDANWFYAVGGANSNVTGVVTVVPDAQGNPKVAVDYQANVWDRYNWDEGKGVHIGPFEVPDGEMAKLHRVGLAQEFAMAGSSEVKHYDLGSSQPNGDPLPGPGESRDGRMEPVREQPDPSVNRGSDREGIR